MKFSIIIPVYNVEKYIENCVKSVLNQSYGDFELLLIDDGSMDNSPLICDNLAKKDERVKVIHKQNGGVSSARNEGIRQANGDYILFLDADDYFSLNLLEFCFEFIKENSNLNVFNYSSTDVYNGKETLANVYPKGIYRFEDEKQRFKLLKILIENGYLITVCWRSCYKKEFLIKNQLFFDETHAFAEDVLFYLKTFMFLDEYVETGFIGYSHLLRENSCCGQNMGRVKLEELNEISYKLYNYEKQLNLKEFVNNHYVIHLWLSQIAVCLIYVKKPFEIKKYINSYNITKNEDFFKENLIKAFKVKQKISYNEFRPFGYLNQKCQLYLLKYFVDNNKFLLNCRLFFFPVSFFFTRLNAKIKRRLKGLFKKNKND